LRNRTYRNDEDINGTGAAVAAIISHHPRESVAAFVGTLAVFTIFINALFLQHGPHPAPIFATAPLHRVAAPAPVAQTPAYVPPAAAPVIAAPVPEPVARPRAQGAAAATHNDPIAALIAPANRIVAVQRALADFGYGQIKPTGVMGPDTQAAIEKFERGHKMPVTGQISERLTRALAAMTGRPID
jgi:hypothetical protein